MVVVPALRAVTNPVSTFTVATPGALLLQVPPASPLLVYVVVVPTQRGEVPLTVPALAVGTTVMVKLTGTPAQPAAVGVTVIVPLIGKAVAFVATKLGILPVPDAAKPIAVLLFVHA